MLYIQLIISFLVGGILIALQTLIAERVSLRWRGIILTIPTTIAISLLFIGIIKTPQDVADAAISIPASIGASYTFVTLFTLLRNFGLIFSYVVSILVWCLFASLIIIFPPSDFVSSLVIFCAIPVLVGYLIVSRLPQVEELKKFPMNSKHLFFRSLLGGFIVALSVALSKFLGNVWGGIFSVFPAAFSSTFIIYYYLQGPKIIPSVTKSTFFPGVIGFILYALVSAYSFPIYGIWIGTLIGYVVVLGFFLIWNLFKKP